MPFAEEEAECLHEDFAEERVDQDTAERTCLDCGRTWTYSRAAAETLGDLAGQPDRQPGEAPGRTEPEWPVLAPAAFHGPLGDLVRIIEPHSESDPAALLVQALAAFGSVVGRGPHVAVEADQHHPNLYVILVGGTAKGRKGTSLGQVRRPFALVDSMWADTRVLSGLSSGEGLIWAVRDPIYHAERDKKTGLVEEVMSDPGIADKRLLVVEPEFAQTLKVMGREGNSLSPVIRRAWDDGRLQSLTKNSPAVATGAHISIIGHITRDELLRHLGETSAANGFANRYLWLLVRRSKALPWGGALHREDLAPIARAIKAAVDHARTLDRLQPDQQARALWESVYATLSEGQPGLLGAMVARAEAQALRLSMVYALADSSSEIRADHLKAALALWDYCESSAAYVFGNSLGDPVADEIARALEQAGPAGMTRSEIGDLFGQNKRSKEVGRALQLLQEQGLASSAKVATGGRPAEVWTFSRFSPFSRTTQTGGTA